MEQNKAGEKEKEQSKEDGNEWRMQESKRGKKIKKQIRKDR